MYRSWWYIQVTMITLIPINFISLLLNVLLEQLIWYKLDVTFSLVITVWKCSSLTSWTHKVVLSSVSHGSVTQNPDKGH